MLHETGWRRSAALAPMNRLSRVALALAQVFLAGENTQAALRTRGLWVLGEAWPWLPALCRYVRTRAGEYFYDFSVPELAEIIAGNPSFIRAFEGSGHKPQVYRQCLDRPHATDLPDWLAALALPAFDTLADLAQWLNLAPGELAWFADHWRDTQRPAALRHYQYRRLEKRSGGFRLLEIPKSRLRNIQGKVLRQILNRLPPHPAAHGFRRAHSCVTHARLHCGKAVILRMDLQDFFTSIPAARIGALFGKLAYAPQVAATLARLCTHATPRHIIDELAAAHEKTAARACWDARHLPQGAPSSPALANLSAFRLDLRLSALAQHMGASYSRYADDLVFSGDETLLRAWQRFSLRVAAIALEEGFRINQRKTRMLPASQRQQITGIVVNRHPNIARGDFDALKAILCNCVRHGPVSQNREGRADFRAYLQGKIAYVAMVNPQRGQKLARMMEGITWE